MKGKGKGPILRNNFISNILYILGSVESDIIGSLNVVLIMTILAGVYIHELILLYFIFIWRSH